MNLKTRTIALVAGTVLLAAGTASALTLSGLNITVNDGVSGSGSWYGSTANSSFALEDNEVEPGMQTAQKWDLEAFYLDGKSLTVVSGYNLYTGQLDGGHTYKAGDIFIGYDGVATYSPDSPPKTDIDSGKTIGNDSYEYEYVLDVDWAAGTYDVVKLDADSVFKTGYYGTTYNWASNPWTYVSGGEVLTGFSGLSFTTYDRVSQEVKDFSDSHYLATFSNLDFLSGNLVFHTTMECGNDNLIGRAAVPEPSTLLLLGGGFLGLAALNRRKRTL